MKNELVLILCIIIFSGLYPQENTLNNIIQNSKIIKNTDHKNLNRAKSHERAGLTNEARLIYNQLFTNGVSNVHIFSAYKSFLYKQEDWEKLIEISILYANAVSPDPYGMLALADSYLLTGNEKEAYKIFDSLFLEHSSDIKKLKRFISKLFYHSKIDYALEEISKIRQRYSHPDFYALDLGNYYLSRMSYEKSLNEYIIYLNNNYDEFDFVRKRLMTFPIDDEVKLVIKKILKNNPTQLKSKILAEYEFKWGNYNQACELLLQNYFSEKELYDFSISMITVNELNNAERIFNKLMKSDNSEIVELSIYQLANILEIKSQKESFILPISNKIIENSFFNLKPFGYTNVNFESTELSKAIMMYDSLIINYNNSKAKFKIAEFKLMTNDDYLKSIDDFVELEKSATSKNIKFESAVKVIDIHISNGDIDNKLINKIDRYKKKYKKEHQTNLLDLKKYQVLFFLKDFEQLSSELKEKLKVLDRDNPLYNEFLDGLTLIMLFHDMDDELSLFADGLLEIKKSNSLDALEKFLLLNNSDMQVIVNLSSYYLSYIYIDLKNLDSARESLSKIIGDDIFSQFIVLLWAEIDDYVIDDINSAVDQYLNFLNEYESSIFYEDVRVRLLGIIG